MSTFEVSTIVRGYDHLTNNTVTVNNFIVALSQYASWGYFDYRMQGEGFHEGYQSVPVDWSTSSERKKGFFALLAEVTGAEL